ncbi:MAG: hypothetical protein NTY01_21190 [Verrucomicrobia bacterium]|nr:hypothetical protein [Verrucomicrobiota bacterium]
MRRDAIWNQGVLLVVFAIISHGNALAQPLPVWLNAQDFGASGSKFETSATTIPGSKQITVAKVGDFKVGQGVMVSKANPHFAEGKLWGPRKDYAKSRPVARRFIADVSLDG